MLFTKVYAWHYNNPLCNQLVLGASILDIAMRYIVDTLLMNHPKNNQTFVMLHTDIVCFIAAWTVGQRPPRSCAKFLCSLNKSKISLSKWGFRPARLKLCMRLTCIELYDSILMFNSLVLLKINSLVLLLAL